MRPSWYIRRALRSSGCLASTTFPGERAAAMESSGTGQGDEERVIGPADERASGDERGNVGRSPMEL